MENKNKKDSASWYIAATHYITAGFLAPLAIGTIGAFAIFPLLFFLPQTILFVMQFVLAVIAVWLGVVYSASYVKKTYVLKDINKIVLLATSYFIFSLAFAVVDYYFRELTGQELVYKLIETILLMPIFYVLSMKYLNPEHKISGKIEHLKHLEDIGDIL